MIKRIQAILLIMAILIPFTVVNVSAAERMETDAAYGTPVLDGEIDSIWDNVNYNIVENCTVSGDKEYKGWFKVMWDENNLYVLARVYTTQFSNKGSAPQYDDSVDIYIDENCARNTSYAEDDYQVRVDYTGSATGNNYDTLKVKSGAKCLDDSFIVEMGFPFKTQQLEENKTVGFEVLMTGSETLGLRYRTYLWNTKQGWQWNNPNCFGTLNLKKSVDVRPFEEPEWIPPKVTDGYSEVETPDVFEEVNGVTTTFDSKSYRYPILHNNEYPCMEISELANVIEGSVAGNTLIKDDVRITFTEGTRLAQDANGHIMLERAPKIYNGKLYVPVSVVMPTLGYYMHYDRFGKTLEITTGTDYPDTEVVFYARDFGAVGDGVTNDGPAILHTVNAAIASGKPAKVELDENKTYLLGERVDNIGYFLLEDVENLVIDGKDSELIIEKCTNTFLDMHRCANVKIQNLEVDYKELPHSQGRILSVDIENGYFLMEIDEGYPLPAVDEWVHHYYTDARTGKWWFGQVMDSVEDRMKFTLYDNIFIESVKHVEGRVYKLTVKDGYAPRLVCAEPGDRFVLNTRTSAYDISNSTHERTPNMMIIQSSGDITLENVTIYGSPWLGGSIGLCWGKINFINFGEKTKPGRLLCVNSDGLHVWRNRAGILVENSTFMNNLDDHINTKGEDGIMLKRIDDYTYEVDHDLNYRVGDELIFFDVPNHKILAKAFLKEFDQVSSAKAIITVDRKIDGIVSREDATVRPTMVYNVSASSAGTIVRNNTFMYSRRHAYITRSQNSIFENNKVIECGGSGLIAKNEIGSASSEGPFPSSFTMRNNEIKAPGITNGYYPVEVKSWDAKLGNSAAVDGFLMENNIVEVDTESRMISIESTQDLYMLNNTIKCKREVDHTTMPVAIVNSEIKMIDGLNFDYESDVDAVISIAGCKLDESNIKNINFLSDNTAKEYIIK